MRIIHGSCPFNPFYYCERRECWDDGVKPSNCAADHFASMEKKYSDALLKTVTEKKIAIYGVESHNVQLNLVDRFMHIEDDPYATASFHDYIRAHAKRDGPPVMQMPIHDVPLPEGIDRLSVVRGSGFVTDDCEMKGIISNAYHDEDEYSLAGTAMHMLINQQHVPNYIHNELLERVGMERMVRSKYCEKEIFCLIEGIPFLGHPDVVLDVGGFALGIMDFKRAGTPMTGYKMQMLSYAVAVNQVLTREYGYSYDTFFLINALHSKPTDPVSYEPPSYYIIKAEREGPLVQKLKKDIVRVHGWQKELRASFENFLDHKEVMEQAGVCADCYPTVKARCDLLKIKGAGEYMRELGHSSPA